MIWMDQTATNVSMPELPILCQKGLCGSAVDVVCERSGFSHNLILHRARLRFTIRPFESGV